MRGEGVGLSADGKRLSTFSLKVPAPARDRGRIAGLADAARFEVVDPAGAVVISGPIAS